MDILNELSVYDVPGNLLALLGSFWAGTYSGRDQVADYVMGRAQIEQQTMLDLAETLATLSRVTVPIYHRENWYPLRILASEKNSARVAPLRYDQGINYDEGYQYDQANVLGKGFTFSAPENLINAHTILNRFTGPTLTLTQNIDFTFTNEAITFTSDPFADSRVAVRDLYTDGVVTDQEALLWVYRGEWDWDYAYRHFGYALGLRLKSSQGYRDLINAVFNALVDGGTLARCKEVISAVTGIPLVREASEIVEDITVDNRYLLIITDKNVYRFGKTALAAVSVGDTVTRGQSLVDALEVLDFGKGNIPDNLYRLSLGQGFLATCFYRDLVFENKELPLTVITDDPSRFTKLTWPLGGFPGDVDRFFDELHSRGVVKAQEAYDQCVDENRILAPGDYCETENTFTVPGTLAHLLDTRPEKIGEPTAGALPRTINPLKFVVANVLRSNTTIVRIKTQAAGGQGIGLQHLRLLKRLAPAHAALIVLLELTIPTDTISAGMMDETLETYTGLEPLADEITAADVQESTPLFQLIDGSYN